MKIKFYELRRQSATATKLQSPSDVLTILDFSKAFDRVWKEDLLLRAVDKGLPLTFAKRLRDFLSNRQEGYKLMENKAGRYR